MRRVLLVLLLSRIAQAQIQPEAEKLFGAATSALRSLSSFDLEAEVEHSVPAASTLLTTKKHISVSVRKPDKEKISITANFGTYTFIVTDNSVWVSDEYDHAYAMRPAILRPDSFLNPSIGRELLPVDHAVSQAEVLREESLPIDGKDFPCIVIRVVTPGKGLALEPLDTIEILWIDKQTGVALKREISGTGNHSGTSSITVTRFLTGDSVQAVNFEHVELPGSHQDNNIFESIMLAYPLHGADFVFSDPAGQPFTVANLQGKPTVLSFTAQGCIPCEADRGDFDAAAKSLKATWGDAIRVVVIDAALPRPTVSESPDYTTLFVTPEQAERQGIQVLPATMITTPSRTIYRTVQGGISEEETMKFVEAAKAQKPLSAAALADSVMVRFDGPGVVAPVATFKVPVLLTSEVRALKITGKVRLGLVVLKDGTVKEVSVVKSLHPVLDPIAVESVRKWLFKPGTLDGQPANVIMVLDIEFKLK